MTEPQRDGGTERGLPSRIVVSHAEIILLLKLLAWWGIAAQKQSFRLFLLAHREGFNKHTNRFLGDILSKDRPLHRFAVPLPRKWEALDMFAILIGG